MIQALALLCALTAPTCDADHSVASIPLGQAATLMECILGAETTLASLAVRADSEHAWKIICKDSRQELAAEAK